VCLLDGLQWARPDPSLWSIACSDAGWIREAAHLLGDACLAEIEMTGGVSADSSLGSRSFVADVIGQEADLPIRFGHCL
jgi:hypothetical protein